MNPFHSVRPGVHTFEGLRVDTEIPQVVPFTVSGPVQVDSKSLRGLRLLVSPGRRFHDCRVRRPDQDPFVRRCTC